MSFWLGLACITFEVFPVDRCVLSSLWVKKKEEEEEEAEAIDGEGVALFIE